MKWNEHSNLKDTHAFMSASRYSWLNYDDEKLIGNYISSWATKVGTTVHLFAEKRIKFRRKLNTRTVDTFIMHMLENDIPSNVYDFDMVYNNVLNYVNDAVAYRLDPEVILYYSDNCYGTADAISFDGTTLRIHDLKTGITPAHMEQLFIYAALFCLEYSIKPTSINYICRIYQCGEIEECVPDPNYILEITKKIVANDNTLMEFKKEK